MISRINRIFYASSSQEQSSRLHRSHNDDMDDSITPGTHNEDLVVVGSRSRRARTASRSRAAQPVRINSQASQQVANSDGKRS
jgi:hypothetical protein